MIRNFYRKLFLSGSIPNNLSETDKKLAKAYQKSRPGYKHHTFCHAAEINMLFSQEGEVFVCCHNQTYSIGKYPEQSISEIWNSSKAKELREKLSRYDLQGGCKICADDFRRGAFTEVRARHFDSLAPHPVYPVMMEFLLSNVCNLECTMCSGKFSSLIRKNREGLPPLHTPYDDAFLLQLQTFIPHLKETRFSGSGEAFSIDMNYIIWEDIIRKNPQCLIMVQTNGTILSARVKEILEKGNFQIGISIDSLEKSTYESIRINASFEKVMENLKYFRDYAKRKGTRFSISLCVMRQNWHEVPQFIRFCNENNAVATLHKVWYPIHSSIHLLSKTELRFIWETFDACKLPANNAIERINRNHFEHFRLVVKEWMEQATEALDIEWQMVNLPILEDANYLSLMENVAKHISQSTRSTIDFENEKVICKRKLDGFLYLIEEETLQLKAIKMALASPIDQFYAALLYQSEHKLKEQFLVLLNS
jgi:radical SAM protein with 4Fe4S-binding SPASM domain